MTKTSFAHRGSALLIVLGMISFMVISAVAFSALMRYSRLPSSYLRRTSSSRHLAHAALAEAIDYIDCSIGDNPHPGFGTQASEYPRENGYTCQRNYWRDRCFIGTNQLVAADETVSTLTLEGLAYLPPSLINEARYYSRHCDTARWHDLGYDSGRYAFFAIDVSDCLNINRVPANWARTSSDLGKLSLAYVFENAAHSAYTVKPSAWDTFMKEYVDFDAVRDGDASVGVVTGSKGQQGGKSSSATKMPLVSLADLNLAAYAKAGTLAQYVSPFCNYIDQGTSFDDPEAMAGAEMLRSLNVITDGYYPPMSAANDEGDIFDADHQPFTKIDTGTTQPPNRQVLQRIRTDGIGGILSKELPPLDLINLYDYLDENDIPTSLALPTTERVPMVCGLQSALKLVLQPHADTKSEPDPSTLPDGGTFVKTTTCSLKVNGTGALSALWMFPFLRKEGNTSFTAETAVRICLGIGDGPGLRTDSGSRYVVQKEGDFTASGVSDSTIRPKVQDTSLSFTNVRKPEDAFEKKDLTLNLNDAASWFNGKALLTINRTFIVHKDENGNMTEEEVPDRFAAEINPDFKPVSANGRADGGLTVDMLKNKTGVQVRPYMTIASRVKSNGKTVDLVPASGLDDRKYNSINTDTVICNISGGRATQPVITFRGDKDFLYGEEFFTKGETLEILIQPADAGGSIVCPDPRWNFAPENFVLTSGNLDKNSFLTLCDFENGGRDCDPFLFVSNQGYLQSISELAFLPRTAQTWGGGNDQTGECSFTFDKSAFETDKTKLPHWNLMWKSYRLWAEDGNTDPLYDLGVVDGGRGPRVNPYSDSLYTTLAALANTPQSWWAASVNDKATGKSAVPEDDAEAFNKKYAFNGLDGTPAENKFAWEDLKKVAQNLQSAMRANADGDWVKGWESLEWDGDEEHFCGVQLTGDTADLYDVDRKFLYGYWRDCFASKQQLFLVFIRAEPLMMGGGAAGRTPPQLGARAVALVWRNPAAGSSGNIVGGTASKSADYRPKGAQASAAMNEGNMPHQTRVLFYRQFD